MREQLTYPVAVISQLLDIGERRVQQLSKEGVLPKAERGKYSLIGCVRGYILFLRSQLPNSGKPVADIRAESARLKKAQANLAEMEEAERKGSLLNAEIVYKQDFDLTRAIRDNLLSLPSRLAPVLRTKKTEKAIHKAIHAEVENSLLKTLQDIESKSKNAFYELDLQKKEDDNDN
jgi:phage terminase Nu1 subunit (DNA packaging protein)